jgi:integrase
VIIIFQKFNEEGGVISEMSDQKRLSGEDIEKLKEAMRNKKTVREIKERKRQKKVLTAKQRRIDDLSRNQKRTFWKLQNELDQMFQKYSNVTRKEPGKKTKKDVKKGLKSKGIWSTNTYENYFKKAKTFLKFCVKNYNIQDFKDLKPGMVADFIRYHLDKNSSPKTISNYFSAVKKMAEFGENEGIKRMKKLNSKTVQELIPEYRQEEYRRGKKDGYTIKDVQVLAKKAEQHFSPLHRAAVEVLGFAGARLDEFRRIKWKHLDFEKNRIYLTDPNMTKGSRPRFLRVKPETMQLLKEIKEMNLHSNDNERIWGSRMSEKDVREFIRDCSRLGKTKYSGIHDFRRSTILYHYREMQKEFKKGTLNKEKLVDRIMEHVSIDPRLNPLVEKKIPLRDKNGNIVYRERKDGRSFPVLITVKDENGKVVKEPKYSKEELMKRRIDYLKNLYLSQILGHNRTDITAVYKPDSLKIGRKKDEEKKK